jgi:hypothetical protein
MSAPVSVGFLLPARSRVTVSQPTVLIRGEPLDDGPVARNWDYTAPVEVEWRTVVDLDGIRQDCNLGPTSRAQLLVTWHSTWTNLRGAGDTVPLVDGENTANLHLPGQVLGGTLALEARIVLGRPDPRPDPLAPTRPGSTLWRHRTTVTLEGAGSRFPTATVDFSKEGIAGGLRGAWYLWTSGDLAASTTGALQLNLNTAHPDIRQMLEQPASTPSRAMARFIRYDIARQLVAAAVNHDELDDAHTYDEGTLGNLMIRLVQQFFPAYSLHDVRSAWQDDPSGCEAELQARALQAGDP